MAALVAATVLAVALFWRSRTPLEFTADGRSAGVDNWVAAPLERPVALEFSDGSTFLVQASSRARVVAVERHGATIALENGAFRAQVVHRPGSAWNVVAGPLTVRVTGTRFDLNWSASEGRLAVAVEEGSVTVSGAVIGAARAVRAGGSPARRRGRATCRVDVRSVRDQPKCRPRPARLEGARAPRSAVGNACLIRVLAKTPPGSERRCPCQRPSRNGER